MCRIESRGFTSLLCQNQIEPGLKTNISFNSLMDVYYTLPYVTHEDNSDTGNYIYVKDNSNMWDGVVNLSYKLYGNYPFIREKVQIDVKEVPYCCLRGALKRDRKHLYQWTAIDECTRIRFIYGFDEHTPENTVEFFRMLQKVFPFKIQTIQTDNGTEFTYKYISEDKECPFDTVLRKAGVEHKLIPPRTPWHNGKVERSHRNDQRYFYDWEHFKSLDEFNQKLAEHLVWSNNKTMRTLGRKSPVQLLREKLSSLAEN